MPIEIEKKYRLSKQQRVAVLQRLPRLGAKRKGEEFEVNTLYAGEALEVGRAVLRLRCIGKRGILTYKERFPSRSGIKRQREDETSVGDPQALELILEALGFSPALVYEKRRETWTIGKTEIVLDQLPFGLFMEIEGTEESIREWESKLSIPRLRTELATYPQLTLKHGVKVDGVIVARFKQERARAPRVPGRAAFRSAGAHARNERAARTATQLTLERVKQERARAPPVLIRARSQR
jgi:adenylate cyclase class 2